MSRTRSRARQHRSCLYFVLTLVTALVATAYSVRGQAPEPKFLNAPYIIHEAESNNSAASATNLPGGRPVIIGTGGITAIDDVDYWSFVACEGCYVYVWVDTGGPTSGNSRDTVLQLIGTNGTTVLEEDDDDGLGTGGDFTEESHQSPLITGRQLSAGRYYLRVTPFFTGQIVNPYRIILTMVTQSITESEPNETAGTADVAPLFKRVTATLSSVSDVDYYVIPDGLQHSSVCVFVDGDPDQNGSTTWVTLSIRDNADELLLDIESANDPGERSGEGLCFMPTEFNIYFRVTSRAGNTGTYSIYVTPARGASLSRFDVDRDFIQDIGVWRPSNGVWYVLTSGSGWNSSAAVQWGASGDIPVPADYDGDGVTDAAVFRPANGVWYIRRSTNPGSPLAIQWGQNGDLPRPGDFDGDGQADPAVFRPATGLWFALKSSTNYATTLTAAWGQNGDVPVVADHDGDRLADFAVWRPATGQWFRLGSGRGYAAMPVVQFGANGDIPVQFDWGFGWPEPAVFRPSTGAWHGPITMTFGMNGDVPVPGDFDTDVVTDFAVWRPSNGVWYVNRTDGGLLSRQWGASTDVPLGSLY